MFANQHALLAKKVYDLINKHEIDKVLEFFSHDIEVIHMGTGHVFRGHSGLKTFLNRFSDVAPELNIYDITNQIVTEDYVVSEYKAQSAHGDLSICEVWKMKHGKIETIHSYSPMILEARATS
jgi:hypothetical protein